MFTQVNKVLISVALLAFVVGVGQTASADVITAGNFTNVATFSSQTLTWFSTPGTGTGRVLVVGVGWENNETGNSDVSSVTYGGTGLTRITGACVGTSVDGTALYYLDLPDGSSSSTQIVVTMANTTVGNSGIKGSNITLFGAAAGGPAATGKNLVSSTTISLSSAMSLSAGQAVVDVAVSNLSNATLAWSGTADNNWISGTNEYLRAGGTERVLAANDTNYTDTWTASTADKMSLSAAAWNPVPEPATMALLGLGAVAMLVRRRRR